MNKTRSEKEFIALMAILMSVVAISIDAMLPALSNIGKFLKITSENHSQYIISAIFVGMGIGELVLGPLSDAKGRKVILYSTLILYSIGSIICLFSTNLTQMLIGRVVQGLGAAGPYVCCMSIVRDKYQGRAMAKIMSLIMMIFISVPVVAPAIGQGIIKISTWQNIFVLYIIYALVVLVWIFIRLEETLPPARRVPFTFANLKHGIKEVFSCRKTTYYTICLGLVFGALVGNLNSSPQIFQGKYAVGDMFVVYFGLQAIGFGFSSLLNSRLVERLGMRYICKRTLALICAFSVLMFIIHIFIDIPFWLFFVYSVTVLFCVGMLFGNLNALSLESLGHIAGLASAIIGFVSSLISSFFGGLIGQLYNGTLFPLIIGFMLLCGSALILICKTED